MVPAFGVAGDPIKTNKRFDTGLRRGAWATNTGVVLEVVSKLFLVYLVVRVVTASCTAAASVFGAFAISFFERVFHGAFQPETVETAFTSAVSSVGADVFRARGAVSLGMREVTALAPVIVFAILLDRLTRPATVAKSK